jgi:hypothetical protein
MTLNVSKTQLIVVGSASNVARIGQVSLDINGTVILSSDCIKSLGLQIDSKLFWSHRINSLSRRFHFMAKSLYPLKPVLSLVSFTRVIEACLISLTNYMVIVACTVYYEKCISYKFFLHLPKRNEVLYRRMTVIFSI